MATSDWEMASAFQERFPHTFNAMQKLVPAMAGFQRKRGRKTLFGRDKGLEALRKFDSALSDTVLSMVMDDVIARNSDPDECLEAVKGMIGMFAETFPNWPDAYTYAHEYFVVDEGVARDRISDLLRR